MKSALILTLLCASGGGALADPWVPDEQTIAKLEATVQLPDWGRSTLYPKGHVPAVTEFGRYLFRQPVQRPSDSLRRAGGPNRNAGWENGHPCGGGQQIISPH